MAVRTDHDRLRVALSCYVEDRLRNVGIHGFPDRQALGLESRIASDPGALTREKLCPLLHRLVDLERRANVDLRRWQPDRGRGELQQLEAETLLPDHHHERRPHGQQRARLGHHVSERERVKPSEAREHIAAVFASLREATSEKEFEDMVAELPQSYSALFPAIVGYHH
jgi:hypothetical protein